LFLMLGK